MNLVSNLKYFSSLVYKCTSKIYKHISAFKVRVACTMYTNFKIIVRAYHLPGTNIGAWMQVTFVFARSSNVNTKLTWPCLHCSHFEFKKRANNVHTFLSIVFAERRFDRLASQNIFNCSFAEICEVRNERLPSTYVIILLFEIKTRDPEIFVFHRTLVYELKQNRRNVPLRTLSQITLYECIYSHARFVVYARHSGYLLIFHFSLPMPRFNYLWNDEYSQANYPSNCSTISITHIKVLRAITFTCTLYDVSKYVIYLRQCKVRNKYEQCVSILLQFNQFIITKHYPNATRNKVNK